MAELGRARGVILENVDLSQDGASLGRVSDGQTLGETGAEEHWLLAAQQTGTEVGTYTLSTDGSWTRRDDPAGLLYGDRVRVRGGDAYAGSWWRYDGDDNPSPAEPVVFELEAFGRPRFAGGPLADNYPYITMPRRDDLQGTWNTVTLDEYGLPMAGANVGLATNTLVGLRVSRTGNAQIRVEPGFAWAPGTGLVQVRAPLVKNLGVLAANRPHYVYLLDNGGEGDVEVVATPPAERYAGGARVKGAAGTSAADDTRRYLQMTPTDPNGNLRYYDRVGETVFYKGDTGAGFFRVVPGGSATFGTAVDLAAAGLVPPGTRAAWLRVLTSTSAVVLGTPDDPLNLSTAATGIRTLRSEDDKDTLMVLSAGATFSYANKSAGGSTNIDCFGYVDPRS